MYRLFASDVDDTLLAHDGSLPEATKRGLQLMHEAGITVVLSSGRATASMKPIVHKVIEPADDEYIISFNGGRVVTALSENVIFEQAISPQIIALIMEYARRHSLHVQGYNSTGFVVENGPGTRPSVTDEYAKLASLPVDMVTRLEDALPEGSVKLLIIGDHHDLLRHRDAIEELSGGQVSLMFSKPHYLEVVASGVSKGHALEMLAAKLQIPLSECVALGDSLNDIEMIKTAGVGAAVANARQELKMAADVVLSKTSDEAALVELIEKYFPDIAEGL